MNNRIQFSIIVPIYKRRPMVTQAVKSILNQKKVKFDNLEIILVDDEKDKKVIRQNKHYYKTLCPNIEYNLNIYDEGPGGARQTGLTKAKGDYVLFLDSDDILEPNYLFEMRRVLDESDSVAVLCMSTPFFDGVSNLSKIKLLFLCRIRDLFLWLMYIFNRTKIKYGSFYLIQFSHILLRHNKIMNLKFNYDYRRGGEDWDFFIKVLNKGDIVILPKRLLKFRYSVGSSTSSVINIKMKWRAYNLLLSRLPFRFRKSLFYVLFKIYIFIFSKFK